MKYVHHLHPRTKAMLSGAVKPVKTADQLPSGNAMQRFNTWLGLKVTTAVGTMWCAYVFAAIALYGLPQALKPGGEGIVSWVAQTFLQLVLLSIIIVGTNVLAATSDARADATYKDAEAVLHECVELQAHLAEQDKVLTELIRVHQ
jgi:hypothetical protein